MIAKSTVLALASLGALALAGCGKQGELERPAPLVGHGTHANAATRARQAAAADARRNAGKVSDPQAPQSADEVRNDGARLPPPPPLKGSPIAGTQQGPNPQPPPGGLGNPLQPSTISQ